LREWKDSTRPVPVCGRDLFVPELRGVLGVEMPRLG
jgi:hypothetical protein